MKLKEISRVGPNTKQFQHEDQLFVVEDRPRDRMRVWTLHKRFRGMTEYRIISDLQRKIPVAVQRLAS